MSACPFCFSTMRSTFTGGLHRERCGRCGSMWFEGEALASVMGSVPMETLARRAKGKPGECKGCHRALAGEQKCARCKRDAPTCPHCHTAPLSIAELAGVKVDMCGECHGVALDPGELDMLLRGADLDGDGRPDDEDGDGIPDNAPATPQPQERKRTKPVCTSCQRKLNLDYAFAWAGKLYCGSCAPEGASPYSDELARTSPELSQNIQPTLAEQISRKSHDPVTFALKWFVAKLQE
jgi:Zn-finger nucleic acid-binding protein